MQPKFTALDAFEFPELHDESVPTTNFFRHLTRLMLICGVKDFSLNVSCLLRCTVCLGSMCATHSELMHDPKLLVAKPGLSVLCALFALRISIVVNTAGHV